MEGACVITPPVLVNEPTPEATGFGLYSAASVLDPDDAHVQSGVMWEPSVCGVAGAFPVNCPTPAGSFPRPTVDGIPVLEAAPFGVSSGQECKIVGTPLDRLRDLARARLRFTEQTAVERAYWTGEQFAAAGVTSPHLAAGAAVTVLSGTAAAPVAVKPALAVGMIEEALGGLTGVVGVIHAPRVLSELLPSAEKGGVLRTKLGTRYAFGAGYPGTGPDGAARPDGVAWIYGTGPVQVVRSPILDLPNDPRDALDRSTNVARIQAVRVVSLGHSCGLVAVPVNLTA
jgi:hypothetical protein